jgi:hypothetical protein
LKGYIEGSIEKRNRLLHLSTIWLSHSYRKCERETLLLDNRLVVVYRLGKQELTRMEKAGPINLPLNPLHSPVQRVGVGLT